MSITDLARHHRRRLGRPRQCDACRPRERCAKPSRRRCSLLDSGKARVAEKVGGEWQVHQWLKKAVLLSFRLNDMEIIEGGPGRAPSGGTRCRPSSTAGARTEFRAAGFRAVPNCTVRRGAYIAPGVVLMPSFVNLGAYVDEGTMVDTWATVGSCAQIGKNVHLSGGVGIGGVLEPLQANPTIIEDNCFIGARSEVVEGVVDRRRLRALDGRVHLRLDQDHRPQHRRGLRRPRAALFGRGARLAPRQAAARTAPPARPSIAP